MIGRALLLPALVAALAALPSGAQAPRTAGPAPAELAQEAASPGAPEPAVRSAPRTETGEPPDGDGPGVAAPGQRGPQAPAGGGQVVILPEGRDAPREGGDDEKVVAALSHNQVSITTTYSGSEIFVFGAVKRSRPARAERPDVIVTISGPSGPVTVRRKDRGFGIWANRESTVIDQAPAFYAVAATGPLDEILSATENLRHRVGLDLQVRAIGAASDVEDPESFREAVIRLMRVRGLYVEAPIEVDVIEDTLFATHVALPANIVEGDYIARVFLLNEGKVLDLHESIVGVRKVGLERWLYALSREAPLAYGLLALAVALAAGWGASEAFRALRR
ncbi:TIGR02186 family protein [Albimonas pacifica]|uniref:Transmembrane protein (Alph_Pro_TM) n=1 Tax=Albimonas pacifica TaxID=1114924 RepID=A0A1I3EMI3_9RHOB|nr:conserved hypothetical protein [Albimonas pacifica]